MVFPERTNYLYPEDSEDQKGRIITKRRKIKMSSQTARSFTVKGSFTSTLKIFGVGF